MARMSGEGVLLKSLGSISRNVRFRPPNCMLTFTRFSASSGPLAVQLGGGAAAPAMGAGASAAERRGMLRRGAMRP
jgi:hypothetical protein